jgi:AbrB family looped-hinge helix DNA binding protein
MKAIIGKRGRVTIPRALRERLGIKVGTVLDFGTENGHLVVVKADPVDRVFGCLLPGKKSVARIDDRSSKAPRLPSRRAFRASIRARGTPLSELLIRERGKDR